MAYPHAALRYYGRVLIVAIKMLRDTHDWLLSWGALLLFSLPPGLNRWVDDRLPTWPGYISLALWLVFMLVRANWQEVKRRDNEINVFQRNAEERYNMLCEAEEFGGMLLLRAPPELLAGEIAAGVWTTDAKQHFVWLEKWIAPLLERNHRNDLTMVKLVEAPPQWATVPPLTHEQVQVYRRLEATYLLTKKYAEVYRNLRPLVSQTATGA